MPFFRDKKHKLKSFLWFQLPANKAFEFIIYKSQNENPIKMRTLRTFAKFCKQT